MPVDTSAVPTAYTDIAQLQARRANTPENLRAAAEQFEAMLADVWLKSMRAATEALGGGLVDSHAMDVHQEMLDHQWAIHMAENGGLGIADVIVRQLQRNPPTTADRTVAELPRLSVRTAASSTGDGARVALAAQRYRDDAVGAPGEPRTGSAASASPTLDARADATSALDSTRSPGRTSLFSGPAEFAREVLPVIREIVTPLGLSPLAVAAQAALETGWGRAVIATADGQPSHNLFGVKAGPDWTGPATDTVSGEFVDGVMRVLPARFRSYANVRESVEDLVNLLQTGARYAGVLQHGASPEGYARALQAAGYATDPDYAVKIQRVVQSPWLAEH